MNVVWSQFVQSIHILYSSRQLRFHDFFAPQFTSFFSLNPKEPLRILEIGCGPGALSGILHRWYPQAEITGVDRDSEFIRFARQQESGVTFLEGDATCLPFPDDSFDVTISHTVSEHIEPSRFFAEQHRVLKPGGVCLVLSSRKGIHIPSSCVEPGEQEQAFWEKADKYDDTMEKYAICKYPLSEAELPITMEKYGFHDIQTGFATIDLTPDNPKYSAPLALDMIEAAHLCEVEFVESAAYSLPDCVTQEKKQQMLQRIEQKYAERRRLYEQGEAQWDTTVSITMIVRGIKKERDNTQ